MTTASLRSITMKFIRFVLAGLVLAAWGALPRSSYSAPAATSWYVATGASDSNPCTTPEQPCEHIQTAIDRAASGDTINIDPGTYQEPLNIDDKSLTLKGQSSANTFIDGTQLSPVLLIGRNSLQPFTINISGVTLQNGKSSDAAGGAIYNVDLSYLTISDSNIVNNAAPNGGGIYNAGVMKLTNVTVRANSATVSEGGGIYNTGSLELDGVLLADNQAPNGGGLSNRNIVTVTASSIVSNTSSSGDGGGGGIYNFSSVILLNSTLSENHAVTGRGGAIFNRGTVVGSRATILENKTDDKGGGVYNDASGQAIFSNGSIRDNTSNLEGGGLFNDGITRLEATLITGNQSDTAGGGLHNSATGALTVMTSAVNANTASGSSGGGINNLGALTVTESALVYNASSVLQGGGLNNAGNARLTNVTISDNTATAGGGIQNSGTLSLQFSTISNNSSPSLNNVSGGVTVGNSILTQNTGDACSGAIVSAGHNIDLGASCKLNGTGDKSNTDPALGPLQDNGGNSPTRAIPFSSVAVDSAGACPPPGVDQRGIVRPQSSFCDRGAYEVAGYTMSDALDLRPGICVTSTLYYIPDKFVIGRLLVGVNLGTDPDRSDLTIRLLSPGAPKVTLLRPAAHSGQNLNTMFDDSAPSVVPVSETQDLGLPFSNYIYKPATPLTQVRGINIKGTWKLEICNAGTATGTLNRWVLVVPEFFNALKVYLPLIRR